MRVENKSYQTLVENFFLEPTRLAKYEDQKIKYATLSIFVGALTLGIIHLGFLLKREFRSLSEQYRINTELKKNKMERQPISKKETNLRNTQNKIEKLGSLPSKKSHSQIRKGGE